LDYFYDKTEVEEFQLETLQTKIHKFIRYSYI